MGIAKKEELPVHNGERIKRKEPPVPDTCWVSRHVE